MKNSSIKTSVFNCTEKNNFYKAFKQFYDNFLAIFLFAFHYFLSSFIHHKERVFYLSIHNLSGRGFNPPPPDLRLTICKLKFSSYQNFNKNFNVYVFFNVNSDHQANFIHSNL